MDIHAKENNHQLLENMIDTPELQGTFRNRSDDVEHEERKTCSIGCEGMAREKVEEEDLPEPIAVSISRVLTVVALAIVTISALFACAPRGIQVVVLRAAVPLLLPTHHLISRHTALPAWLQGRGMEPEVLPDFYRSGALDGFGDESTAVSFPALFRRETDQGRTFSSVGEIPGEEQSKEMAESVGEKVISETAGRVVVMEVEQKTAEDMQMLPFADSLGSLSDGELHKVVSSGNAVNVNRFLAGLGGVRIQEKPMETAVMSVGGEDIVATKEPQPKSAADYLSGFVNDDLGSADGSRILIRPNSLGRRIKVRVFPVEEVDALRTYMEEEGGKGEDMPMNLDPEIKGVEDKAGATYNQQAQGKGWKIRRMLDRK